MTKFDNFLSTGIEDHKQFSIALNSAVKEIRAQELNMDLIDLVSDGDKKSRKDIHNNSIYRLQDSNNTNSFESIPEHLSNVLHVWENSAIVFRGTRLPDNNSSFDIGGIHTTPQLEIANAYATGAANSSTGLGRLLKYIEGGFITSYEVSLTTETYKNFEFEDLKKTGITKEMPTLQNLKDNIIVLAQSQKEDFYLDSNEAASPKLKEYFSLIHNYSHYETIIPTDSVVKDTYFRTHKDIVKISDNSKWEQILTRVQEASLRDFYEVLPLEKLLQHTSYIKEHDDNKVLLDKTKLLILETKQKFIDAPWECQSLKDVSLNNSEYSKQRPYITHSQFVGSAMDNASIDRPEITKKLESIVEAIRTNDLINAQELLEQVTPDTQKKQMVTSSNLMNSITAMRKKYQPEEKSVSSTLTFR